MTVAERVQGSIRAVNAASREPIEAGAFTLYRDRASDHPYLNYAVPRAAPWTGIDALRAACAERDLRPRLEFVAECAPGLEEALAAAGFEVEMRIPVMTCAREDARAVPLPEGVTLAPVAAGADARAYREVGAEAFGQPPPSERELAAPPPAGGILARVDVAAVGIGVHTAVAEGVSEIAGIGVLAPFRRRGIAGAITAAASAAAFAEGAELCFLTPGDDGAERVYARAGFARAGTTMVHMLG